MRRNGARLTGALVTTFPVTPGDVFGGVEAAGLNLVDGLARRGDVEVRVINVGRAEAALRL